MTLPLSPHLHDEIPELVPEGSERLRVGLETPKISRSVSMSSRSNLMRTLTEVSDVATFAILFTSKLMFPH